MSMTFTNTRQCQVFVPLPQVHQVKCQMTARYRKKNSERHNLLMCSSTWRQWGILCPCTGNVCDTDGMYSATLRLLACDACFRHICAPPPHKFYWNVIISFP